MWETSRNNLKKHSVSKKCSDLPLLEWIVLVISKILKILGLQFSSMTRTIFSHSRSEQFEKQNTRIFYEFRSEKQMTLPNRSMSVSAGMPVLAVENLRTVLTKERVPHMDHYRHSIDHRKPFWQYHMGCGVSSSKYKIKYKDFCLKLFCWYKKWTKAKLF